VKARMEVRDKKVLPLSGGPSDGQNWQGVMTFLHGPPTEPRRFGEQCRPATQSCARAGIGQDQMRRSCMA
jgi:hypothetical protein